MSESKVCYFGVEVFKREHVLLTCFSPFLPLIKEKKIIRPKVTGEPENELVLQKSTKWKKATCQKYPLWLFLVEK